MFNLKNKCHFGFLTAVMWIENVDNFLLIWTYLKHIFNLFNLLPKIMPATNAYLAAELKNRSSRTRSRDCADHNSPKLPECWWWSQAKSERQLKKQAKSKKKSCMLLETICRAVAFWQQTAATAASSSAS